MNQIKLSVAITLLVMLNSQAAEQKPSTNRPATAAATRTVLSLMSSNELSIPFFALPPSMNRIRQTGTIAVQIQPRPARKRPATAPAIRQVAPALRILNGNSTETQPDVRPLTPQVGNLQSIPDFILCPNNTPARSHNASPAPSDMSTPSAFSESSMKDFAALFASNALSEEKCADSDNGKEI